MNRIKHFMILALALAMSLGAWAQQEELLTTVTATGQTSYSQSPDGIVTVTLNYIGYYDDYQYGWLGGTVTVEANQGYTITRCVFRQQNTGSIEDDLAPFTATMSGYSTDNVSVETSNGHVNGDADQMIGITSIEVYGYAADPSPTVTHNTDGSWGFTMPDYDAALNVTYYSLPALAWTYNSAAMPAEGLTAYRGFELPVIGGIGASMDEDFLTALQGGTVSLRYGSVNGVVTFTNPYDRLTATVTGSGLDTVYMVFDGNDDYLRDSAFFAVNILDPDTLTLAANGNGTGTVSLDGYTPGTEEQSESFTTNQRLNTYTGQNFTVTCTNAGDDDGIQIDNNNPITITSTNGQNITRVEFHMTFGHNDISTISSSTGTVVGGSGDVTEGNCSITGINATSVSFSSSILDYVQINQITVYYGTPATYPDGIAATETENTYRVLPGTQLSVTATPGEGSYLAQWSDGTQTEPVEGDARLGSSHPYTMPATAATLTATFNEIPVLTLASNNSEWGTVEMEGAGSGSSNGYTIKFSANGNTIVKENVTLPKTYQCEYGSPSEFDNIIRELYGWTGVHGNENAIPTVTGTDAITPGTESSRNYPKFTINSAFQGTATVTIGYTNSSWVSDNWPIEISFVPALPAGVLATTEEGVYNILPGTEVKVIATPDPAHYFVNWDEETALNSNTAVEKTLTMGTAAVELTANFAAKPVLTLAANDTSWGKVTLEGAASGNNSSETIAQFLASGVNDEVWHEITGTVSNITNTSYGNFDLTDNTASVYVYGLLTPDMQNRQFESMGIVEGTNITIMAHRGEFNSNPEARGAYLVSINTATLPEGVVQLTDTTYRVDYGTEVTLIADATELHHVANWEDQNGDSLQTAAYSAYFITEPEPLFPDSSSLTFTVTTDTVAKAVFGLNFYQLTFAHNEGGTMEFVIPQDSMSFTGLNTTMVQNGDITVKAESADHEGMFLKNGTDSIRIAIAGASITQVDFHVTNGTNLVNTISVEGSSEITTTQNNEYGSVKGLDTNLVVIKSSTDHDLQIDQLTVHYGRVLPEGVLNGPDSNIYYVLPDSTVVVRAIPADGHYLVKWDGYTDILDTLTASVTMSGDDTLTATFAPNPVITLAVSDPAMGSVYFTGYEGNTVTRAGIIKAQSIELPYQWYEASEIMSIEGGNGMVAKDANSHYVIVNGIFAGTATVVTSTGAFSVTCEPTLPNGVHYNIAADNYTVMPYTEVSLTATPNANHYFVDWAKVTVNDNIRDSVIVSTDAEHSFRIDGDMKLQGNFLHNPYLLTLVADSVMGTIEADSAMFVTLNNDGTYTVMADSTVTVMAAANTGYHITGWSNNTAALNTLNSFTTDTIEVKMTQDSTVTISFDTNIYNVMLTVQNDERNGNPMGTVTGADMVKHFLTDTLTATAEYGYTFAGWYDADTNLVSELDTLVISPVSDTALTAMFTVNEYAVNGLVLDTLAGYVTGSDSIAYLDTVVLRAYAKTGYHFEYWQDTTGLQLGAADTLQIIVEGDTTVYAVYDTNHYNLVVTVDNASTGFGTVTGSVAEARHFLDYVINATADSGYHFVMWSNGSTKAIDTVSLVSDSTIAAIFDTNVYNLNVVVADSCTGFGTVTGADSVAKHFLTYDISATANPGYHFVMWSDGETDAVRTVSLTSDTTIAAIFDYNPALTLVYDENKGHLEFIVATQTATFNSITTDNLAANGLTVVADSADAYGISLKNGKTLTITADSAVITQVAFHLTNGTNKADSIRADAGTVITATGNAYGSVIDIRRNTVVITSTSDKDINIDQLTIQYAKDMPDGVVRLASDEPNVYRVNYNSVVNLLAVPSDSSYLVRWEGDTTSASGLTAVVTIDSADATVIANFLNNPVMTLIANGNGRVYFEGYEGYTVNRNENILVTNFTDFPHTWYESSTITEIIDTTGMVTRDQTNHYVSVHGAFNGTATVVTTSGSFTVTCIPTVPNGVEVLSLDTYTMDPGTEVTVIAVPDAEHYLVNWSDLDTVVFVRNITVADDTVLEANFLHNPYTMTLVADDTTMGTLLPAAGQGYVKMNADSSAYIVMADSTVTLVATPASKAYYVANWDNDTLINSDSAVLKAYTVSSDTTVTAHFGKYATLALVAGHGGQVSLADSMPVGVVATDSANLYNVVPGTEVALTAVADSFYHFVSWSNDSVTSDITVAVTTDTVLTATFDTNTYILALAVKDGCTECGSVTGADSAARHFREYTVVATPTPCYHFVAWTDTLGNVIDSTDTLRVSPVSDTLLVANFALNIYKGDTTVNVCDSFTWHDSTYTVTPATKPTFIYKTANNCDSTVTLNLTIRHSTTSDTTAVVCDTILWNDSVYAVTGNYPYVTTNAAGCDSTATLHLTVKYSTSSLTTVEECESYIWHDVTYTMSTLAHYDTINAVGCDSIAYLDLTINYNGISEETVVTCDSVYEWNGIIYTSSTIGTWHGTTVNGCDSTATLYLTLNNVYTGIDERQACESFTWVDGVTYTESTDTPTYVYQMENGCDSTVTLHLTISNNLTSTDVQTACDSYTWIDGETYTESTNTPTYVYHLGTGCDSTVTLDLTVNHSVEHSFDAATCSYYIWDGTYYNESGEYTKTYQAASGCDSVVTLTLTVNQPATTDTSVTACGSYVWNGVVYTASGAYSKTLQTVAGCDSTVNLTLTINQPTAATVTVTAGSSYEWNGTTYTESGVYTYTTTGSNGCDSVTTLNLTIFNAVNGSVTVTACDSYTWNDSTYTESGDYTYSHLDDYGNTQVDTLHLTINNSVESSFDDAACNYYIWDGTYYTASGSYSKHYTAANNCDSTVTLNLTVYQPVTNAVSETACGSYIWNGVEYAASGAYTQTLQTVNGCDSTVTLTLTVKQPTAATVTETACDSYTWHDITYTATPAVAPTFTTTGSNGCDSVTTLKLTVNYSNTGIETVTACDSYEWHGTTYTASNNTATYTETNAANCDSVVTLNLTINYSNTGIETVTACESYEWHGTTYTASNNTATYTETNAANCDSVVTLNLTINYSNTGDTTAVACGEFTWYDVTYTSTPAVAPTHVFTNANGCDSTVTLNLTVNYSTYSVIHLQGEGTIVWNGESFTESGVYERTLTNAAGCDSVVTLVLAILPAGTPTPYLYNIMDVMLTINHNAGGMENVHYVWYRWYRDGEMVLEGPNMDSYSEGGNRLNGCYHLEVATDESLEYWVSSNEVCIGVVGIDDVEGISVTLAPNPVINGGKVILAVEADNSDLQGSELQVFDAQGRLVLNQKNASSFEANFASGMYMVRLTLSDGRSMVKRLIVR